jgi:hypothetical protein
VFQDWERSPRFSASFIVDRVRRDGSSHLPPLQRTSAGTSHASRFRSTGSGTGSACMLQAHESSWLRHVPFYVHLPTSLPVSGLSALLRTSARAPYPKEDEKYDAGSAINPVPVPKACGDFSKQPRIVESWREPGSTYPPRFCLSPSLASDITCSSSRQKWPVLIPRSR